MRYELEEKLARFETLELDLADPVIQTDPQKMAAVAREHGVLARVVSRYRGLLDL